MEAGAIAGTPTDMEITALKLTPEDIEKGRYRPPINLDRGYTRQRRH